MAKNDFKKISNDIRRDVLNMIYRAQSSHVGSNLSCIDILTVIYFGIMKPTDKFILSKGWAAASVYAILAKKKYFPEKKLLDYGKTDKNGKSTTPFMGLISHEVKGVSCSTGSMGHGLPIGLGMAIAQKINLKDERVFVLMSDGEMDCGTTWESALFAAHHKLDNLVVIIDYNKLQAFGKTNEVLNLEPLKDKWTAFGWEAKEINGHDYSEIESALSSAPLQKNRPTVIIAHTIKGKGVSFMENKIGWHYWSINKENYDKAIAELKKNTY